MIHHPIPELFTNHQCFLKRPGDINKKNETSDDYALWTY